MRLELVTQEGTRRVYTKLQVVTTTKLNMRLTVTNKSIADPTWKTALISKDRALDDTLTLQLFSLTTDRLHRAKLHKKIMTLDTKVNTILTPLIDTFEYQHIIQKFDYQHVTDEQAAKYSSK